MLKSSILCPAASLNASHKSNEQMLHGCSPIQKKILDCPFSLVKGPITLNVRGIHLLDYRRLDVACMRVLYLTLLTVMEMYEKTDAVAVSRSCSTVES
jgi:hypothetical protein